MTLTEIIDILRQIEDPALLRLIYVYCRRILIRSRNG